MSVLGEVSVALELCKLCVIIGEVECNAVGLEGDEDVMGWILLFILEAVAPVCDLIEGSLQAESAIRFIGAVIVQGNKETHDSEITQFVLLKSGQRIMNWRIVASDCLLNLHHGNKFDYKSKQRPQVILEPTINKDKYSDLVISFTEKITGLRAREESTDKNCEQLAIQYLQVLQKKNSTEAIKCMAVPWLAENEKLLKTLTDVAGQLRVAINQSPTYEAYLVRSPLVIRYAPARSGIKRLQARKLLDEVLGLEGRIVLLNANDQSSPKAVLVRIDNGLGQVVGGPLNPMKLFLDNDIPTQVVAALKNPTLFELLSLSPSFIEDEAKRAKSFYGYDVLGKTRLANDSAKQRVITAFLQAIEASEGLEAVCFNPRHGIRIVYEKKQYDFVICYECMQIGIYEDGKPLKKILTTRKAQSVLDDVLKQAGIPLAEKSK